MGKTLGERIRTARKELGYTQERLAGKDFTKGFISLVELDKAKPSLESLTILAARLNRPLTYFLEDRLESRRDIDVLINLGEGHLHCGQTKRAFEEFKEALRLSRDLDDPEREGTAWRHLGTAHRSCEDFQETHAALNQATLIFKRTNSPAELAYTYYELGRAYQQQRKFTQAIGAYRSSFEYWQEADMADASFELRLHVMLAAAYNSVGETNEARNYYEKAVSLAKKSTDLFLLGSTLLDVAQRCHERQEVTGALRHSTRSLELFQMYHNVQLVADVHNSIGIIYASDGKWDEALQHYQESLALRQRINDVQRQAYTYTELARYYYRRDDLEMARSYCNKSLELVEGLDDPVERARACFVRGLIERKQGSWEESVRLFHTSAETFDRYGIKADLAEVYSELGFLYAERGDTTRSNEYLGRSVVLFREAGFEADKMPRRPGESPGHREQTETLSSTQAR